MLLCFTPKSINRHAFFCKHPLDRSYGPKLHCSLYLLNKTTVIERTRRVFEIINQSVFYLATRPILTA